MSPHSLAENLLANRRRRATYEAILARPGITFSGLLDHVQRLPDFAGAFGHGALVYHVGQLERFALVSTRKSGNHRRHYPNEGPWASHASELALLQTPSTGPIARLVVANAGLRQRDLWEILLRTRSCTRPALAYHLDRLRRLELVSVQAHGNGRHYFPTDKALHLLAILDRLRLADERPHDGHPVGEAP